MSPCESLLGSLDRNVLTRRTFLVLVFVFSSHASTAFEGQRFLPGYREGDLGRGWTFGTLEGSETRAGAHRQPCYHIRWIRAVRRVSLLFPLLAVARSPELSSDFSCFIVCRIKGLVLKRTGKDKLSPGMAFLVGAASKTLATVVRSASPHTLFFLSRC